MANPKNITIQVLSWAANSIEPGQTAQIRPLVCLFTVGTGFTKFVSALNESAADDIENTGAKAWKISESECVITEKKLLTL